VSIVKGQSVKAPKPSVGHVTVCVTVPEEIVNVTVPDSTQSVPLAVSAAGNVPFPDDSANADAPSNSSRKLDPVEAEELGPAGEEEETVATFEPPTDSA
jgi:hypothetical protein